MTSKVKTNPTKAISAIIIVVMLLLISIALISVVFIWASGLLGSTTTSVGESTISAAELMQTNTKIQYAKNISTDTVQVVLKNTGTLPVDLSLMDVFVDGEEIDKSNITASGVLKAGTISTFYFDSTDCCDKEITLKFYK